MIMQLHGICHLWLSISALCVAAKAPLVRRNSTEILASMKNAHSRILSPALALLPSSFCVAFIPRPRLATALFSKCRNESLEKSRLNVITYLFTLTAHIPHVIFCHLVFLFSFLFPFSSLLFSFHLFSSSLHYTSLDFSTLHHFTPFFFSFLSSPLPSPFSVPSAVVCACVLYQETEELATKQLSHHTFIGLAKIAWRMVKKKKVLIISDNVYHFIFIYNFYL